MSRAIRGGHTKPSFVRSPLKDAPAIKKKNLPGGSGGGGGGGGSTPPLSRDRPLFTRTQRLFSSPLTSVIFAFFARDSPTQREAARSKREAPRQTGARAGGQSAIDGPSPDGDPEGHLQWMEGAGEERKKVPDQHHWSHDWEYLAFSSRSDLRLIIYSAIRERSAHYRANYSALITG